MIANVKFSWQKSMNNKGPYSVKCGVDLYILDTSQNCCHKQNSRNIDENVLKMASVEPTLRFRYEGMEGLTDKATMIYVSLK